MDQRARRVEYLRSRIEALNSQKERLATLASAEKFSQKARNIWKLRLDYVTAVISKHTEELARLEQDQ